MKKTLFFASLVLFLGSCQLIVRHSVRGDGQVTHDDRKLQGFNVLNLSGAVNVKLVQDSVFKVTVVADSNLQPYIITDVEGNILYIHQRDNSSISPSQKIWIEVQGPSFRALSVSGASTINTPDSIFGGDLFDIDLNGASSADLVVNGTAVNVTCDGASELMLAGQAQRMKLEANGSSEFKGYDFLVADADVQLGGASKAKVMANDQLSAKLNGASRLNYRGDAKTNFTTEGASSVDKD